MNIMDDPVPTLQAMLCMTLLAVLLRLLLSGLELSSFPVSSRSLNSVDTIKPPYTCTLRILDKKIEKLNH